MNIGNFELCLNVKDITKTTDFYKTMGFESTTYKPEEGVSILKREGLTVSLYKGWISENMLNFRGGDVFKISEQLASKGLSLEVDANIESDGSQGATLRDPDGNLIYFNTSPGEEVKPN